jgi:hypothetical protein
MLFYGHLFKKRLITPEMTKGLRRKSKKWKADLGL